MMSEVDLATSKTVCRRNSFYAEDHAIGILLERLNQKKDVRISHPEKGELFLSPSRGTWSSSISDRVQFFLAPKDSFLVEEWNHQDVDKISSNIDDLLWEAAIITSQGRLVNGLRKFDVIQFSRWPNLACTLSTPNTMRICALLSRYPTGIILSGKMLKVDESELFTVCSAAQLMGIVTVLCSHKEPDPDSEQILETHQKKVNESKTSRFFSGLWSKLNKA